MKISIVIPTYKRSEYLTRAIDSVLNQTYSNIEIVVVDDNLATSIYRKDTELKMLKYANNNKIIYIKNHENLGGALARNEGIFKSTGDYITFLDDDDIFLPEKVANQLNFMLENKLEMSFSDVMIHNNKGVLIDYREHQYVTDFSNHELLKQHILHHLTPTSTYMYRKDIIEKLGGFDDVSVGQEFMLMLKTINNNVKIGYLPEANVIQYIHNGERISVGANKLKAEKNLYNIKANYFSIFNKKELSYIKFRHFVVMMIVSLRSKKYLMFIYYLVLAVILFPKNCYLETKIHLEKLKRFK